jgi:hypothetical protein
MEPAHTIHTNVREKCNTQGIWNILTRISSSKITYLPVLCYSQHFSHKIKNKNKTPSCCCCFSITTTVFDSWISKMNLVTTTWVEEWHRRKWILIFKGYFIYSPFWKYILIVKLLTLKPSRETNIMFHSIPSVPLQSTESIQLNYPQT